MSRGEDRAKKRYARLDKEVKAAAAQCRRAARSRRPNQEYQKPAANQRLIGAAQAILRSEFRLSLFERQFCTACSTPVEVDEMLAMLSQLRAPHLAGSPSHLVRMQVPLTPIDPPIERRQIHAPEP